MFQDQSWDILYFNTNENPLERTCVLDHQTEDSSIPETKLAEFGSRELQNLLVESFRFDLHHLNRYLNLCWAIQVCWSFQKKELRLKCRFIPFQVVKDSMFLCAFDCATDTTNVSSCSKSTYDLYW